MREGTLKNNLYQAFEAGQIMTLPEIANYLYQDVSFATQKKAYGAVSQVRKEAEKNGILLHCVEVLGREQYKFLNNAEEVKTRIKPAQTRVQSGMNKLKLVKDILSEEYKDDDGVKECVSFIRDLQNAEYES